MSAAATGLTKAPGITYSTHHNLPPSPLALLGLDYSIEEIMSNVNDAYSASHTNERYNDCPFDTFGDDACTAMSSYHSNARSCTTTMNYRMLHTHTLIIPHSSFFESRYLAPKGGITLHISLSQPTIDICCMVLWYYCCTHLVDGEEVSALGSIRVIPFKALVHVCFALSELARQAPVKKQ